MTDKEDWLLRPVMRGMCRYESLKNGELDMFDIATMNDAIDVEEENRFLIAERNNGG